MSEDELPIDLDEINGVFEGVESGLSSLDEGDDSQVFRENVVAKALKVLLADAQRCEGELPRDDVNRVYIKRRLTIAECIRVEESLIEEGVRIFDEEEEISGQNSKSNYRFLSQAEEIELSRRIQLANQLPDNKSNLDPNYIAEIMNRAEKARGMFVLSNIRYVQKRAAGIRHRKHLLLEDLQQEGIIGLMRAIELFDPTKGFRFKTYATWWIEQNMRRALADGDRIVRLPAHVQELLRKIRKAQARLTVANSKVPTFNELSTELGIEAEKLQTALWRVQATDCVEGDAPNEEGFSIMSLVADQSEDQHDISVKNELRDRFSRILTTLTSREERIIRMRFGVGLEDEHTLESIGSEYGVTRERIRQIESKALRKLRHPSRSNRLKGFLDS